MLLLYISQPGRKVLEMSSTLEITRMLIDANIRGVHRFADTTSEAPGELTPETQQKVDIFISPGYESGALSKQSSELIQKIEAIDKTIEITKTIPTSSQEELQLIDNDIAKTKASFQRLKKLINENAQYYPALQEGAKSSSLQTLQDKIKSQTKKALEIKAIIDMEQKKITEIEKRANTVFVKSRNALINQNKIPNDQVEEHAARIMKK